RPRHLRQIRKLLWWEDDQPVRNAQPEHERDDAEPAGEQRPCPDAARQAGGAQAVTPVFGSRRRRPGALQVSPEAHQIHGSHRYGPRHALVVPQVRREDQVPRDRSSDHDQHADQHGLDGGPHGAPIVRRERSMHPANRQRVNVAVTRVQRRSSTSRIFCSRRSGVNGFWIKSTSGSRTPWLTITLSVYPEAYSTRTSGRMRSSSFARSAPLIAGITTSVSSKWIGPS